MTDDRGPAVKRSTSFISRRSSVPGLPSSVAAGKPIHTEQFDIVPRLAALGQVSQNFADDAGKFEAVARAG
jgi:hypothetical protein